MNFIKCAFCSGHEAISSEATGEIEFGIRYALSIRGWEDARSVEGELENILNVIENTRQRECAQAQPEPEIDPLLL